MSTYLAAMIWLVVGEFLLIAIGGNAWLAIAAPIYAIVYGALLVWGES